MAKAQPFQHGPGQVPGPVRRGQAVEAAAGLGDPLGGHGPAQGGQEQHALRARGHRGGQARDALRVLNPQAPASQATAPPDSQPGFSMKYRPPG